MDNIPTQSYVRPPNIGTVVKYTNTKVIGKPVQCATKSCYKPPPVFSLKHIPSYTNPNVYDDLLPETNNLKRLPPPPMLTFENANPFYRDQLRRTKYNNKVAVNNNTNKSNQQRHIGDQLQIQRALAEMHQGFGTRQQDLNTECDERKLLKPSIAQLRQQNRFQNQSRFNNFNQSGYQHSHQSSNYNQQQQQTDCYSYRSSFKQQHPLPCQKNNFMSDRQNNWETLNSNCTSTEPKPVVIIEGPGIKKTANSSYTPVSFSSSAISKKRSHSALELKNMCSTSVSANQQLQSTCINPVQIKSSSIQTKSSSYTPVNFSCIKRAQVSSTKLSAASNIKNYNATNSAAAASKPCSFSTKSSSYTPVTFSFGKKRPKGSNFSEFADAFGVEVPPEKKAKTGVFSTVANIAIPGVLSVQSMKVGGAVVKQGSVVSLGVKSVKTVPQRPEQVIDSIPTEKRQMLVEKMIASSDKDLSIPGWLKRSEFILIYNLEDTVTDGNVKQTILHGLHGGFEVKGVMVLDCLGSRAGFQTEKLVIAHIPDASKDNWKFVLDTLRKRNIGGRRLRVNELYTCELGMRKCDSIPPPFIAVESALLFIFNLSHRIDGSFLERRVPHIKSCKLLFSVGLTQCAFALTNCNNMRELRDCINILQRPGFTETEIKVEYVWLVPDHNDLQVNPFALNHSQAKIQTQQTMSHLKSALLKTTEWDVLISAAFPNEHQQNEEVSEDMSKQVLETTPEIQVTKPATSGMYSNFITASEATTSHTSESVPAKSTGIHPDNFHVILVDKLPPTCSDESIGPLLWEHLSNHSDFCVLYSENGKDKIAYIFGVSYEDCILMRTKMSPVLMQQFGYRDSHIEIKSLSENSDLFAPFPEQLAETFKCTEILLYNLPLNSSHVQKRDIAHNAPYQAHVYVFHRNHVSLGHSVLSFMDHEECNNYIEKLPSRRIGRVRPLFKYFWRAQPVSQDTIQEFNRNLRDELETEELRDHSTRRVSSGQTRSPPRASVSRSSQSSRCRSVSPPRAQASSDDEDGKVSNRKLSSVVQVVNFNKSG